jgi:hypothetical protein
MLASILAAQVALFVSGACAEGSVVNCTLSGCSKAQKYCEGGYWSPCECLVPAGCTPGEKGVSKDDVETLLVNENEHGLDYHLRSLFDVPAQCGHVVGEALSRAGLALVEVVNPRTGRKVRGMNVARCPPWVESLRPVLFEAIRDEGVRQTRLRNRRAG